MSVRRTQELRELLPPEQRVMLGSYETVFTGTACLQRCKSCPFPADMDRKFREREPLLAAVERAAKRGAKGILFSGGEPSLHPNLTEAMRLATSANLNVAVATNGALFSEIFDLDELYQAGMKRVHVHLFSSDPERHGRIAGGQADLQESARLIRRLTQDQIYVVVVVPLLTDNLLDLSPLLDLLVELGVQKVHLTRPGNDKVASALSADLSDALQDACSDVRFDTVSFDQIPLCLAGEKLGHHRSLRHREPALARGSHQDYSSLCVNCAAFDVCDRPLKSGASAALLEQVRPFQREGSNSFNFVPEEVLATAGHLTECPIRGGDVRSPALTGRQLMFHHNGRLAALVTDTGDFSEQQIQETVSDLGQLYLDVSSKLLLDDFEQDLRSVAPDPECGRCPKQGECPGAYSVQPRLEGFSSSERTLNQVLKGLRGRVLDVGVGEPFSLLRAFGAGDSPEAVDVPFRYFGIEPDVERVEALEERFPWMNLRVAGAEDPQLQEWFGTKERPFDHILLLRSYNHLRDLVRSFQNLSGLLKPGGTMIVVENTTFGLIRGRKKMLRLQQLEERGEAPFEHYRNHTSHEAVEILSALGFMVQEHRAVSPESANQWIVTVQKKTNAIQARS